MLVALLKSVYISMLRAKLCLSGVVVALNCVVITVEAVLASALSKFLERSEGQNPPPHALKTHPILHLSGLIRTF